MSTSSVVSKTFEYTTKEYFCYNEQKQKIYGIQYIPKIDRKVPLIIFSHGLGSTHVDGIPYAERLAQLGIAVYTYDFRGGGPASQSDLKTTEMTVFTEVDDLLTVFNTATTWDFVDTNSIYLMGASQGGAVSTITAPKIEDKIKGLILIYPAYVITDDAHRAYKSLDEVKPEFLFHNWIILGKNYMVQMWDYDIYEDMKKFKKPVIIIHGDKDDIVPISYSERAVNTFAKAELRRIKNGCHGFDGQPLSDALDRIIDFLKEQRVI